MNTVNDAAQRPANASWGDVMLSRCDKTNRARNRGGCVVQERDKVSISQGTKLFRLAQTLLVTHFYRHMISTSANAGVRSGRFVIFTDIAILCH